MAFGGGSFRGQVGQLGFVEAFVPGVAEEAIEYTGEVLKMEARGGDTGYSLPKKGIRKGRHQVIYFLASLEERMCNGLQ